MFGRIFKKNIRIMNGLFTDHYLDIKAFYVLNYNEVPCVGFIGELDPVKAFNYIDENFRPDIISVYQHSYFDHAEQKMFFNSSIYVLKKKRMIELAQDYCQVLHTRHEYTWADDVVAGLAAFRVIKEEIKITRVIGFAAHQEMN